MGHRIPRRYVLVIAALAVIGVSLRSPDRVAQVDTRDVATQKTKPRPSRDRAVEAATTTTGTTGDDIAASDADATSRDARSTPSVPRNPEPNRQSDPGRPTGPEHHGPTGSFTLTCKERLTLSSYAAVDIPCTLRSHDGFDGTVAVECDYPPQANHCPSTSVSVPKGGSVPFTYRFTNGNNDASTWGFALVMTARAYTLRDDVTIMVNERRTALSQCTSQLIGPGGVSCTLRWDPAHASPATLEMVESSTAFTCTAGENGEPAGTATPDAQDKATIGLTCTQADSPDASVMLRVTTDGFTETFTFGVYSQV